MPKAYKKKRSSGSGRDRAPGCCATSRVLPDAAVTLKIPKCRLCGKTLEIVEDAASEWSGYICDSCGFAFDKNLVIVGKLQ